MKRLIIFTLLVALALAGYDAAAKSKKKRAPRKPVAAAQAKPKSQAEKDGLFIIISKKDLSLSVCRRDGGDAVVVATYPACLSKNKGNKQRVGDMRTPESPKGKPFKITQIQDAHTWKHDFKDGRGNILAYGHWFLRLLTPGHSGIGIHGSTNNESSVPGRASEGCIRLRDADIISLKEKYAYVGMPVIILAEDEPIKPYRHADIKSTNDK